MVTVPGQIRNTLLGKGGQEGEYVWQMAGDGVWGWGKWHREGAEEGLGIMLCL